jgi:hypothetical protein
MPGLLDQYDMRDYLTQAPRPQIDPQVMQRIQQQALQYSQRFGMPYQQALQELMRRMQMSGPRGQPAQMMTPTGGVRG